ncbi:SRPBCC domain-containing protein [Streptomyces qinglanensis]|uniref:Activator of Hsp90 ATPase homolog 1-like protein n=1 Tax=Streptomyces qinglanensis TaxID=943816 RepID=A0A1H9WTE6_9ACTN|nr:SRPBCC domain-containing protein [Streptomyces qinglanensis]SES37208.1 hypothetical protein SAMN05421870_120117 [Streptomyces qinglanensis]
MSTEGLAGTTAYGIPYGTARSGPGGAAHTVGFELAFPHPLESVWAAVATPAGLRGWLAAADPFEPGPGGAVTLHWWNGEPAAGADGPQELATPGRITAWSRRRLAEYTVDARGSFGFTLRGSVDDDHTRVRFRNDFTADAGRLHEVLARWHEHFELLQDELRGQPTDWASRTAERFTALRDDYARRC